MGVEDEGHPASPKHVTISEMFKEVHDVMLRDRRVKVTEIFKIVDMFRPHSACRIRHVYAGCCIYLMQIENVHFKDNLKLINIIPADFVVICQNRNGNLNSGGAVTVLPQRSQRRFFFDW